MPACSTNTKAPTMFPAVRVGMVGAAEAVVLATDCEALTAAPLVTDGATGVATEAKPQKPAGAVWPEASEWASSPRIAPARAHRSRRQSSRLIPSVTPAGARG